MSENKEFDSVKSWCVVLQRGEQEPDLDNDTNKTENSHTSEVLYVEDTDGDGAWEKSKVNIAQNSFQDGGLDAFEVKTVLGDNNSECSTEFDVLEGFQCIHSDIDADLHPEADIDLHPEADIDLHSEADIDLHREADIDRHPEADIDRHPEADIDRHPEADIDLHREVDIDAHCEVDADIHAKVDAYLHTKIASDPQASAKDSSSAETGNNFAPSSVQHLIDSALQLRPDLRERILRVTSQLSNPEFLTDGDIEISGETKLSYMNKLTKNIADVVNRQRHSWNHQFYSHFSNPDPSLLSIRHICLILIFQLLVYISFYNQACLLYSGFVNFVRSDSIALNNIQGVITKCYGEQYQMGLISENKSFLNSRVCVYKQQEYTALLKDLLSQRVTNKLLDGLKNPEDPSFLSYVANSEVLDISTIINQLQFYKLLPVKKIAEDGTPVFKEADYSYQTIEYSFLNGDMINELVNVMDYYTKSSNLLTIEIKLFDMYFEDLTEAFEKYEGDTDFMNYIYLHKVYRDHSKPYVNPINDICSFDNSYHDQVKNFKAIKDEQEVKPFATILNSVTEMLDMHHATVKNFCEFYGTFRRLDQFILDINFVEENDESAQETLSNFITSYLKGRQEAFYDFFQSIDDAGGLIQWYVKTLKKNLNKLLQFIINPIACIKQYFSNMSTEIQQNIILGLMSYIFGYLALYIFIFYILPRRRASLRQQD